MVSRCVLRAAVSSSSQATGAAFAAEWLREQRALWQRLAAHGDAHEFAAAEAAWNAACDRWWQQVGSAAPAPMAAQLRAALDHTRMLVRLARTLAGDGTSAGLAAVTDPAMLFGAALDAIASPVRATHDSDAERAYTRAYAALVAELADIAHEAFTAAHADLARAPAHTPQDLYARYADALETRYRARAGSDAFARLVGAMINAQVDALTARRHAAP
jgi:hypothetical protein